MREEEAGEWYNDYWSGVYRDNKNLASATRELNKKIEAISQQQVIKSSEEVDKNKVGKPLVANEPQINSNFDPMEQYQGVQGDNQSRNILTSPGLR